MARGRASTISCALLRSDKDGGGIAGLTHEVGGAVTEIVSVGGDDQGPLGGVGEDGFGCFFGARPEAAQQAAGGDLKRDAQIGAGFQKGQIALNVRAAFRVGQDDLEPGVLNGFKLSRPSGGKALKGRLHQRPAASRRPMSRFRRPAIPARRAGRF